MPELMWVGKSKVLTHHLDVPFRLLDRQYSFDEDGLRQADNGSANMIIHGDNLEALKALLPRYEGRVDVVYIDPPYNTGEERWIYNDNVNDPVIRQWLGEVVGREGEDLSRHDKWLSMMYPRLRLLHRLLSADGLFAVSIGDAELHNLGAMLDEIFGARNRLATAPVRSEPSGGKDKSALRTGHEYVLFYSKGDQSRLVKEEKSAGPLTLKDSAGMYRKGRELRKWGATSDRKDRPNLWFPITDPDGQPALPFKNDGTEGYWRWGTTHSAMAEILKDPSRAHWERAPFDAGVSVNGATSRNVPYEKVRDVKKSFGWNTWLDGYGTNADATAVIKAIFGSKEFDTPKPLSLIEWIISLHDRDDALVLDSFAGSGTTGHATLKLNATDGGTRKFILVELGEYAESVTAERVRRVISGKVAKPDSLQKTGGDFSYYELGEPLFNGDELNPSVPVERLRDYIWYTETAGVSPREQVEGFPHYLGTFGGTAYHLHYDANQATVLNHEFLAPFTGQVIADTIVIYADSCILSKAELSRMGLVFKKIPRDISRF
ncbi:site-specific DNA-methyltransferase [Curtobacterium aurantiacum]|uniref:site-specific DNA-methyltransferase n=1 Tax=Curtobacterium aurantiacum TaxID=3236919 RepID=UPI001BE0293E|nr:site-specific DNA-methyltransferase [Curtobacterium flaccumfaciens]MBT1675966.1 site-specific DNA-methyltransferase [Curtobacterium flaccumfaciens pv. flaccumfaciens]